MTNTIKLSKPLVTHSGEVRTLTLRELIGADMAAIGKVPVIIKSSGIGPDRQQQFDLDFRVVMKYAAQLTGIDESILGTMPAKDFMRVSNAIAAMFADDDETADPLGNGSA